MYKLRGYDDEKEVYITVHGITNRVFMLTMNPDRAIVFDDVQDAMDGLIYINDLQTAGKFPRVECLDVVDENGNEIYMEA